MSSATSAPPPTRESPALLTLHAAFLLAGFGTLLLGPMLPVLSARWRLNDAQSGLLLTAQFLGATAGGSTISGRLGRSLIWGVGVAAAGWLAFAVAPNLLWGCAALLAGGFGIGRTISATNIIAGIRFSRNRGAALSWLNVSWGVGALLSPLTAALAGTHLPHGWRVTAFAACLLALGLVLAARPFEAAPDAARRATPDPARSSVLARRGFAVFLALLFLYGGLETCLGGWLTTFAVRSAALSLADSQYATVLLLAGLTLGRAGSARLLALVGESPVQRTALALTAAVTALLAFEHAKLGTPGRFAAIAVLLGVVLAPVFPATFALLIGERPSSRQAGLVLAASGIGAAGMPALMGAISRATGSLPLALGVPIVLALAMLALAAGALGRMRGAAGRPDTASSFPREQPL